MIVRMKKLTALLHHSDRDGLLAALQELGVVHIAESEAPESAALQETARKLKQAQDVVKALGRYTPPAGGALAGLSAEDVLLRFEELDAKRLQAEGALAAARKDEALLTPWGEFDPAALRRLEEKGWCHAFYRFSAEAFAALEIPGGLAAPVFEDRGLVYSLIVAPGQIPKLEAEEVRLPLQSLRALRGHIALLEQEEKDARAALTALAADAPVLSKLAAGLRGDHQMLTAQKDLASFGEGKVLLLTGWFPAARTGEVRSLLERSGAWSEISDPGPSDSVPIQMRNNAFTRLYEPLLRMYSLPAYMDLDPTVFFAPFFTLFVGLCIGDVGYGGIILLLSLIAFLKVPEKLRPLPALGMILGGMTMLAGVMLNGFFGNLLFGAPGSPGGEGIIPFGQGIALLTAVPGERGTVYPMMSFALLVGFVQLMLAFCLRLIAKLLAGAYLAALMPLGLIFMPVGFLSWAAHVNFLNLGIAGFSVSGVPFGKLLLLLPANAAVVVSAAGVPLFLVADFIAAHGHRKMSERFIMTFVDFYNNVTGIFGNILSYLRLFALGLAGGMLGGVFNQLAFGFITGPDGARHWLSPMVIFTVLLLVAGHGLNLVLSMVGAFVHPLRLTFVEFLQNLDFAWGGKEYRPLMRHRAES